MSSKDILLTLLQEARGEFVSGQQIGATLGLTRAAVWKSVEHLRAEGYEIEALTRRGYRLNPEQDHLSAELVRLALPHRTIPIQFFSSIESTNQYAKKIALQGTEKYCAVIAEEQTAGRGRNNRSFHSPAKHGLYLSLLLKLSLTSDVAMRVTSAVAVAVCRAIESLVPIKTGIKWVNDIFIGDKKVGGILTEGVIGLETGRLESVVVGIGLNVSTPSSEFPLHLQAIATSLSAAAAEVQIKRANLAAAIIDEVLNIMDELETMSFLTEYRERSIVINQSVLVSQGSETYEAVALEINNQGALIVQTESGEQRLLNTGEISLKVKNLTTGLDNSSLSDV